MLHFNRRARRPSTALAASVVLALLLIPAAAEAITVRNNSPYTLRARVLGYESLFDFEIQGGSTLAVNLPGAQAEIVGVRVETFDLGDPRYLEFDWLSIVTSRKDGYVDIQFIDRPAAFGAYNIVLSVDSFDDAARQELRSTSDGTTGDVDRSVRFLATADCQYDQNSSVWNGVSNTTCSHMTNTLLQDASIRGILNAGDLTQNGWNTEYDLYHNAIAGFSRFWFDGLGNHDYDTLNEAHGNLLASVRDRKRNTPKARRSPTGQPHYSWDWHDVHFVQLNLYPGNCPGGACGNFESYDPYQALSFLISDLQDHVGSTCRPVVLVHHYGFDEFSTGGTGEMWWTPAQRRAYWDAIANYNVIAVFSGHLHHMPLARFRWNWERPAPDAGGPPFIPNFLCGAAGYGAYLDVTIDEFGTIDILRMDETGRVILTETVAALPELYVRAFPFLVGDGTSYEPYGQIRHALGYVQPPTPACRPQEAVILLGPGNYREAISEHLVISSPVVLDWWLPNQDPSGEAVIGGALP